MGTREHETIREQGGDPADQAGRPLPAGAAPPVPPRPAPGRSGYAGHLDRLAAASGTRAEPDAVAAVLSDPDPVMADSAVVTHLDRRAVRLPADATFADWAGALRPAVAGRPFPARRLREWTLLKAMEAGGPWSADDLVAASDWCQHAAALSPAPYEALAVLATSARTGRARNVAAQRLRRLALPTDPRVR
ncbi:hypothetical protein AB0D46_19995 [Streptomyces sp. NPDC048383]|uniref:hypothetical protein n=1 Tax=Streptomyces sp. NPDC048383 TaxID=3155386 RepID=UPI00341E70BF